MIDLDPTPVIDSQLELIERTGKQCERLLAYLKSGGSINLDEARERFGIRALSQRIGELRGMGHDIKGVIEENKMKRYWL